MRVRIKRTTDNAVIPSYQSAGAAGLDLHAVEQHKVYGEGFVAKVRTGIAVELPEGYCAFIRPRSGLGSRGVLVITGLLDSDFRGELKVQMTSLSSAPYVVEPGERIAQLVIMPVPRVELVEVDELSETIRGESGFGSSGRF